MESLRAMHNSIKFKLLEDAVNKIRLSNPNKNITLLDLGVGRCNDIHKWNRLNINTVVGIDANLDQLEEGKKRIAKNNNIILYHIDLASKNIVEQLKQLNPFNFDIVVAFFSIHYFIENMAKIIKNINKQQNCFFISTFLHLKYPYFAHEKYFENNYIFIKYIEKNKIEVKFKDAPYFKDFISSEIFINPEIIKFTINGLFNSFSYKNFLSYFDDISKFDDDLIVIELIHGSVICELK